MCWSGPPFLFEDQAIWPSSSFLLVSYSGKFEFKPADESCMTAVLFAFCAKISSWLHLVEISGLFVKQLKSCSGSILSSLASGSWLLTIYAGMFRLAAFLLQSSILYWFYYHPGIQRCIPFVSECELIRWYGQISDVTPACQGSRSFCCTVCAQIKSYPL